MARSQYEINAQYLINTGKALSVLGTGLLIAEVIVGIFALDIAMLICISREDKCTRYGNRFLTGYLWGQMSRQNYSLSGYSLLGLSIGSFVQSLLAGLLLTFEFGMPLIALGVLAAWLGSIALIATGYAVTEYANIYKASIVPDTTMLPNDYHAQFPRPSAPPM